MTLGSDLANAEQISISEEDEAILVATRGGAAYVLDLLARTARPGRGAALLLRALGQIARTAAEAMAAQRAHWFFGALSVDVCQSPAPPASPGKRTGIHVDVMTDYGGPREHLFPRFYFDIPLEELRWLVERVPELAGPLRLRSGQARFAALMLYMPKQPLAVDLACESGAVDEVFRAEEISKVVVSPESLFDPDATSPVPALMEELARSSIRSKLDTRELF